MTKKYLELIQKELQKTLRKTFGRFKKFYKIIMAKLKNKTKYKVFVSYSFSYGWLENRAEGHLTYDTNQKLSECWEKFYKNVCGYIKTKAKEKEIENIKKESIVILNITYL